MTIAEAQTFETALEPRLALSRWELLREAQVALGTFEQTRAPEARGRLLQLLEDLALLVRAEPAPDF